MTARRNSSNQTSTPTDQKTEVSRIVLQHHSIANTTIEKHCVKQRRVCGLFLQLQIPERERKRKDLIVIDAKWMTVLE